ncbi:hypothetical protein ONZ45_g18407 [Pleurotus djamor]|nr:hypothetical protein ONZ45_g18407 [Pleurotus djamor]
MSTPSSSTPKLNDKQAVILFIFTLLAFTLESQLTQYVQTTLQYRHPYFIFYLVHTSFALIFPVHLLYLMITSNTSPYALLNGLSLAVREHLAPGTSPSDRFPRKAFLRLILALTLGVTCPALLWFAAISMASVSDVTAMWNMNAFFAYIFTVKIFHLQWESRRLLAVIIATLGTVAVVYGGSTASNEDPHNASMPLSSFKPSAPILGDLLTLIASAGYGLYQVLYKKYAALPSDPEVTAERLYEALPAEDAPHGDVYDRIEDKNELIYPPPFGLHPNMLTSAIGLCTMLLLWIPLPILHYLDAEKFAWPSNAPTFLAIGGIALGGLVFNAGFMILLGVWGPIITSVGNLLTIVLVFLSDVLFGAGIQAVTTWSLVGCGAIIAAFGVLAYDTSR